tara:strand:+ start:6742 stop:6924 length:183 start_codon:yes stop_codon:yes gene_type:complete
VSKKRAIHIVKNLKKTIAKMQDIKITVDNEQFPPARADKNKLRYIAQKLIKKYNLQKLEI